MSLLDNPDKIIFKADMLCKLEACKEWINNHLPSSIKNDPSIFLTESEYDNIIGTHQSFYNFMEQSYKMGHILLTKSYGDEVNSCRYISMMFNKIYLYTEDDKIKLDVANNGMLVLENVEDIPDPIMELILPLMLQEVYISKDLEQEIIKSRWTYRKGRVIFNYTNPELMLPHRTIYIKNEI